MNPGRMNIYSIGAEETSMGVAYSDKPINFEPNCSLSPHHHQSNMAAQLQFVQPTE